MKQKIIRRPIHIAIKPTGKFTEEERAILREKAFRKSTAGATMTIVYGHGEQGELLLSLDVYMVKQLGLVKRLRHMLRMIKATVARYIHMEPRVTVIAVKKDFALVNRAKHGIDESTSFIPDSSKSILASERI